MSRKIKVFPTKIKNYTGYDLQIKDENATVQDYIDCLDSLFLGNDLSRDRNQVLTCEGCPNCCDERIPLTSIDINIMLEQYNLGKDSGEQLTLINFITKFAYVVVEGPVIDITLRRPVNNCINLNKMNKCSNYLYRPMVCRTYFCCPTSKRAEKLREIIVNTGEDELVRLWLNQALNGNYDLNIDEAYDPELKMADWQENTFTGKRQYNEIKIKDLCSSNLWSELIY